MKWIEAFNAQNQPDPQAISEFIGPGGALWLDLLKYIETAYQVKPKNSFSKCAAQPGWNVKYQKSSKSLCTLYPMEGFFIALIVIGAKEENETESALELFTPYVQDLYRKTSFSCGGRWLMIQVHEKAVLEDIKRLMAIRVKPKVQPVRA
jgi:hypothetical protein